MSARKDVYNADDDTYAQKVGNALIGKGDRGMNRGAVAFGDPDHVAEQIAPYKALGFTEVVIRTMTVPQEEAVRSIELAGKVAELLAWRATCRSCRPRGRLR